MNLPNAAIAEIAQEKITEYLLNPLHPDSAGKASFFGALGFHIGQWQALASALRELAENCPVTKMVNSVHGAKYVVDGRLATPTGKRPFVRTVWIVDCDESIPRLVTAYPHDGG